MTESATDLRVHENKWMAYEEVEPAKPRRTRIISVVNRRSRLSLGLLKWYGPWREYSFFPYPNTLFNNGCMRSISGALDTLNIQQKERKHGDEE